MAAGYNKKTRALSSEEYKSVITSILEGFTMADGKKFRPNRRLAMILQTEATTGMRISDVLSFKLDEVIRDGSRYRLDKIEQKTGKKREFTVPKDLYIALRQYSVDKSIKTNEYLFGKNGKIPTERAIQKQLAIVCDYLELKDVSTHSFRKTFASNVYENSGYNLKLVQELLQHSSIATTQRYLGTTSKQIEEALEDITDRFLMI